VLLPGVLILPLLLLSVLLAIVLVLPLRLLSMLLRLSLLVLPLLLAMLLLCGLGLFLLALLLRRMISLFLPVLSAGGDCESEKQRQEGGASSSGHCHKVLPPLLRLRVQSSMLSVTFTPSGDSKKQRECRCADDSNCFHGWCLRCFLIASAYF
jgi:hypothetical protein